MRIAVISTTHGISWGGSEELWATMVDEALKQGLEVAVSISQEASIPSKFAALQQNGARVCRRRPRLRFARIERIISKMASPFREAFRFNPDVICISQSWSYETLFSSNLLDLLYHAETPYIVVCQYNDDHVPRSSTRELAKEFFERAFRVVFVSKRNFQSVERQLAQALPNAMVLQNPVNLFDLTAVPWSSLEPVSMASVARLEAASKGQDILFEVLGSRIWRGRNWRLRLYGEGPDRNYLEALAKHYAISERVEFCGHINDVRSIWAVNHLLVLPSRAEGTPLVLIESMLSGRPAVVTDVGGNAEWIQDHDTGFVAEAASARSFGATLERAWLARADWQKMGLQARDVALIKFDRSAGKSLLTVLLDAIYPKQADLESKPLLRTAG
jgi:glycosyltransferase involved in cell wall biosynthesis